MNLKETLIFSTIIYSVIFMVWVWSIKSIKSIFHIPLFTPESHCFTDEHCIVADEYFYLASYLCDIVEWIVAWFFCKTLIGRIILLVACIIIPIVVTWFLMYLWTGVLDIIDANTYLQITKTIVPFLFN